MGYIQMAGGKYLTLTYVMDWFGIRFEQMDSFCMDEHFIL